MKIEKIRKTEMQFNVSSNNNYYMKKEDKKKNENSNFENLLKQEREKLIFDNANVNKLVKKR